MSEHYGATDECRIPNMGEGASEAYHAAGDEQDALLIDHEEVVTKAAGDKPTLAPVGSRLKRNMQIEYNPYDWRKTLFVMEGRTYISRAFYVVGLLGSVLVVMSGIGGIGLEDTNECRAWCSRFALGTQPHAYLGFCLFLLMAFRNQQAYKMYQSGLRAQFRIKDALRRFVDALLNRVPRDAIAPELRSRAVAFAVAFPYAVTADIREERFYDKNTIENLLSFDDLEDLKKAPTQPLFILESLVVMVHKYVEPGVSPMAARTMFSSLEALYEPYGECERIRNSPCAFSYIAHLRLLLVVYLVTLPLAMVEQMGWSTIPVAWVICYFLMSLEMIAVEVENPFGHGTSDLRLFDYNLLTKESILETYDRWQADFHETSLSDERLEKYSEVQMKVVPSDEWAYW